MKISFVSIEGGITAFGFRKMASFARSIHPIAHPDDNYVHSLAGFMDFTKTESCCNHAGDKALTFLVVAMHILFNYPKPIIVLKSILPKSATQ